MFVRTTNSKKNLSSSFLSAVLERPDKALTLEKQDKVIMFQGLLRGASWGGRDALAGIVTNVV